jgi:beta-phosphoglucomutase-like phosphatase (HAD superfamily)
MNDKTFVSYVFERAKKPVDPSVLSEVLAAKIDLHRGMIEDELPLFPGVLTFLKNVSRHFSIGLVSMANKVEIGYVFERAKLGPLFSVLITADDVSVCKPAPDCYRAGFDKLNEKRQQDRRFTPGNPVGARSRNARVRCHQHRECPGIANGWRRSGDTEFG